ncbi:cytochrome P450 [Microbispora sp. ATCC PTA-5024]|uniref:cytochrome P450 n=1 Tax=Microbispora sp. ATCC PTA-5024 TaxID=316330 RepID=UPI0003DDD2CB|nr:cytochrome P450 [Microbispora sp. ATCC PTA-5024]ETK37573.1 cytochrome P450 [Microbispora sp. ATCC PTA-5024]
MADLPLLPFEQPHPLRPAPALADLQATGCPVHRVRTRSGHEAWLVTGYEEVRGLLADDRLGRSHPDPANAARTGDSALFGGPQGDFATEREDHRRMRALLQPHFSPGRMRVLRDRVETLTAGLLDDLVQREPPADLTEALALPLPILVICELLGVPYEDRDRFRAWTLAAADVRDRARSEQGLGELFAYGRHLVRRRRDEPGDDVISRLRAAEGLGDDEIAMLSMALLFAGHETTVVRIGMGALLLLTTPGQWRALLDRPGLVPAAVEEVLRAPQRSGGGAGIPRYAREDLEVAGLPVAAGEMVLLDTTAADHDPAVFPDPDRFDVLRYSGDRAAQHLAFGHGPRYCIGAPLARIELTAVFSQLVPRFPDMRLAVPAEELQVRRDALTGGLVELPVTW